MAIPDLTMLPALTAQHMLSGYPISENDTVHQYAAQYYQLAAFTSWCAHNRPERRPTVRIIKNAPFGTTNEWWSNSYSNMDSTLTRSFDLSHVTGKQATLQFAVWYNLEQDDDYAYVEVSTDGRNWTTLKGRLPQTAILTATIMAMAIPVSAVGAASRNGNRSVSI